MSAFALVVTAWLAAAPAGPSAPVGPSALPVRRVVLYGNGVAFVERRGLVKGRAEVRLPVRPSQVDDVLKSLVVLDLGHGRVGAVGYDTPAPAETGLGEVPFRLAAATSGDRGTGGLAEVLRQLQGAEVAAATAEGPLVGRVLTVETRRTQEKDGRAVASTHLVLAGEGGALASVDLARVRSVRVLDGDARRDLGAFARATAAARRHDATTIVVSSEGKGARELVVGYTVASPVWKTTYRAVLDAAGEPFVQGWAIVDNAGGDDWHGVRLSLVSGSPLSFVQHLQQPLFRHRPVLPLPDGLRPDPQLIGLVRPLNVTSPEEGVDLGVEGGIAGGVGGGVPGGVVGGVVGGLPSEAPPEEPTTTLSDLVAAGSGVSARARPVAVGDLFDYRVEDPVSVPRGRSALIPILQQRLAGERVSFWGERERRGERPLAALRLRNTSSLTLEAGPITVLDGDIYAGEAQLARLRPGEERFVSYAADLATLVETRTDEGRQPAFLVRVREGAFEAHFHRTRTTTYTVTNQSDRPRVVYVEQARQPRWDLDESGPRPAQEERDAWRFRVELAPKARVDLPVTERLALMDRYLLASLSEANLRELERRGLLDAASRAGLERILALRARTAALEKEAAAAEREAAEIAADQSRLRENVKAIGDRKEARDLLARWVARADAQERRLEELREKRRQSEAEGRALRDEVDSVVRGLEGERRPSGVSSPP
jgi:hypothetical protein